MRALLALLLSQSMGLGATFYVATTGNNANDGSSGSPWLTIQYAATNSAVSAGDTIRVRSGTFDERVTGTKHSLTFVGSNSIVRGWNLTGITNTAIYRFEITHGSTNYAYPPFLLNTAHSTRIEDCYVHDICSPAVPSAFYVNFGQHVNYTVVRSNRISKIGYCDTWKPGEIILFDHVRGTNNLLEYNYADIIGDDFCRMWGFKNIVRNNYNGFAVSNLFTDFDGTPSDGPHADAVQGPFDTKSAHYFDFSNNMMFSNSFNQSHIAVIQDYNNSNNFGPILIRGNVSLYNGDRYAGIMGDGSSTASFVYWYHNTIGGASAGWATPDSSTINWSGTAATNGLAKGNIIYQSISANGSVFDLGSSSTGWFANYNLCNDCNWQTANSSNGNSKETDPGFENYAGFSAVITSSSAARTSMTNLTLANGTGSESTTLIVDDSRFFSDGWSIGGRGDLITVGSSPVVEITAINYATHTATLSSAISWSDNDPVRMARNGLDIGALPYYASGYTLSGNLTWSGSKYTLSCDTNLVRFVAFYENDVPVASDFVEPFEYTSSTPGITCRVYAFYPSSVLALNVVVSGGISNIANTVTGGRRLGL